MKTQQEIDREWKEYFASSIENDKKQKEAIETGQRWAWYFMLAPWVIIAYNIFSKYC